ncbi:MAG: SDR family NAD(P)-dependent oxidoreductase [bacterium]|nr:SDR family NAD(P)-dependent oxidoreductase [bacterium]
MKDDIKTKHSPIAVIGLGCRYPGSRNPTELWENILTTRQQFREMPNCRLPLSEYYNPDLNFPDTTYGKRAALIDGYSFDWGKKRIPRLTYESTDIAHWLALDVAEYAIHDAGYDRETIPKKNTGVIVGNTLTGEFTRSQGMRLRWPFVRKVFRSVAREKGLSEKNIKEFEHDFEESYKSVFTPITEDFLAGGLSNTIAGRVCNFFDLSGGGYTVDGACSSSLIAVITAARALAENEMDIALAGGVDISLDTFELIGFAKTKALTTGNMTVYDKKGSGFIPGEGCAFIVLKRLEDAISSNDKIYAVINGWGISSDGKGGITAPTAKGQSLALKRAYTRAGYHPSTLHFIEGHGTGTRVGDAVELSGVAMTLQEQGDPGKRFCGMTSLKSILGHTKAAAGIGAFVKAVMAVNRRIIPPTAGCEDPHQFFYEEGKSLYPVMQGEMLNPGQEMRAGVSAMGFGGINSHVTLSSGKTPYDHLCPDIGERALLVSRQKTEIYVLSSDSFDQLIEEAGNLTEMIKGISISELTDLAVELWKNADNDKKLFRAGIIASSLKDLEKDLELLEDMISSNPPSKGQYIKNRENTIWIGNQVKNAKVGFLFPGQGSQKLNMTRCLIERFHWAQSIAEKVSLAFEKNGIENLLEKIYRPVDKLIDKQTTDTWFKELSTVDTAQASVLLSSLIWFEYLKRLKIKPSAVGGHSQGELMAFYSAGAFTREELIDFSAIRGKSMASVSVHGSMVSLKCSLQAVEELLQDIKSYATIANINKPDQVIVSGTIEGVNEVIESAKKKQITTFLLPVSGAFHSKLMEEVSGIILEKATIPKTLKKLKYPLFSSMTGNTIDEGTDLHRHFADQVASRVEFVSMANSMLQECDILLEVGIGEVLSHLTSSFLPGKPCFPVENTVNNDGAFNRVLAVLFVNGISFNWQEIYKNRLVRPFSPASEKEFITNPVERPLFVKKGAAIFSQGNNDLVDDVASSLDLPGNALSEYLSRRRGFISRVMSDIIKADMDTVSGDYEIEDRDIVISNHEKQHENENSIEAILQELAAGLTGFEKENLTSDLRLLDDLNLDSIKAGELVAQTAKALNISEEIDMARFSNSSFREIAKAFQEYAGAAPKDPGNIKEVLFDIVSRLTGFEKENLTSDLRLLDDLNLDSIKAGELVAQSAKALNIPEEIDMARFSNSSLREIAKAFQEYAGPGPKVSGNINELLFDTVTRLTGFDKENLTSDLRLLDDLNLDSIKTGELINGLAKTLNINKEIDTSQFVNSSLHEIMKILESYTNGKNIKAPSSAIKIDAKSGESWVRNFVMKYIEKNRTSFENKDDSAAWSEEKVVIVSEKESGSLNKGFSRYGAAVEFALFNALDPENIHSKNYSEKHIVAIVPEFLNHGSPWEAALKDHIHILYKLVRFVKSGIKSLTVVQLNNRLPEEENAAHGTGTASVSSFAASLHHENPGLKIRIINFSPMLRNTILAEAVINELTLLDTFVSVAYNKDSKRYTSVPILQGQTGYKKRQKSFDPGDLLLVTGGAKGITAECALALAKKTGVAMALLGSSPHPGDADPEENEIAATLKRFHSNSLECRYYQCNITDPEMLEEVSATIRKEMGIVSGIIHGAGINKPRLAGQASLEDALQEVSPKLQGALNLCKIYSRSDLKLFAAFSSIIGVTGMPGNAWYAFSNEALNTVLKEFKDKNAGTDIIALAYAVWGEVGMGHKMGSTHSLARMGIGSIPTEEGVNRFLRLIENDPGAHEVIVTARLGGLDTWQPVLPAKPKASRFLEKIVYFEPGVEVIARAVLNPEYDLYLNDHNFNGSLLLPTVLGLEAMAQAVAYVSGRKGFNALQLEDVSLERPIVVSPDNGIEIQIKAVFIEPEKKDGEIRVKAGIATELSNFNTDHFSAVFVLDEEENNPGVDISLPEPLEIMPVVDLYGWLLFQGPLFRRIKSIYKMTDTEALFSSIRKAGFDAGNGCFRGEEETDFILGDPFFRDTLLQSIQLSVTGDVPLPVTIDSMYIYDLDKNISGELIIKSKVLSKAGDDINSEVVVVTKDNHVIERLSGYGLKILEARKEKFSPADIANMPGLYKNILQEELKNYQKIIGETFSYVSIYRYPNLIQLPRDERHGIEKTIFKDTLKKVLRENSRDTTAREVTLDWEDSGKPVINGIASEDIFVSLSHDDVFFLTVVGMGAQGCDIEPIEKRSHSDWKNLLGSGKSMELDKLLQEGEDLDTAGTCIWSAVEALVKASGKTGITISYVDRVKNGYRFSSVIDEKKYTVLALPIDLLQPLKRIIAFIPHSMDVDTIKEEDTSKEKPVPVKAFSDDLIPKDNDAFTYDGYDEKGRKFYLHRFRLSFSDSSSFRRKLPFSLYAFLMGKLREMPIKTVKDKFVQDMASGQWGIVTNNSIVKISGEATSFDLIEGRVYTPRMWGEHDTSVDMIYDFFKISPDGSKERIAYADMGTTWVKVLSHGTVAKRPLPPYLHNLMKSLITKYSEPDPEIPSQITGLHLHNIIFNEKAGPKIEPILVEQDIKTSYEDSNVVGNVYYANYYAWQGRVFDLFLFTKLPDYFSDTTKPRYDLFCISTKVDHLREAMPFDTVKTTMALKGLYENGVKFYFEYFRVEPDGTKTKLAIGEQESVWIKINYDPYTITPENFPPGVLEFFKSQL